MYKLGITGSIGSGKSSAARHLADLGAMVCDADIVARDLLDSGSDIQNAIIQRFGSDLRQPDGRLNRSLLAERAFADPAGQQFLNDLIHPAVIAATLVIMAKAEETGEALFIVDAPLLFEAGMDAYLNAVLVVTAQDSVRRERVMARSGISSADFQQRNDLQLSQSEKMAKANFIIENNTSLEELNQKVEAFFEELSLHFT